MRSRLCLVLALLALVASPSCSKDTAPLPPTAPTTTATNPTVTTLSVVGTAPIVRATAQFTATATLSNGSNEDVTNLALWSSSNDRVAGVNGSGLVTGVGAGDADISATYQNVAGRWHVSISRVTYTVTGTITDGTSGGVLPNIKVIITDGTSNIGFTTTDGAGRYSIGDLFAGPALATASGLAYQLETQRFSIPTSAPIDLVLPRAICRFTVTPSTFAPVNVSGGTGSFAITSQGTHCVWTAKSNSDFVTITSGTSGVDAGTVNFAVPPNPGGPRDGTLTVAGTIVGVIQSSDASPAAAVYDSTFKAPVCQAVSSACHPVGLLNGSGSTELHAPNTIFDACPDGASSTHMAAISEVSISTDDQTALAVGKAARISVISLSGSANRLRVYLAPDAEHPVWRQVGSATGFGILSFPIVLPATPGLQAIRVNYSTEDNFGAGPCALGADSDNDDLVFRVR